MINLLFQNFKNCFKKLFNFFINNNSFIGIGFLRFFLAASVLMAHVGGGPMLSARLSVFCFYIISGYLITRVLNENYRFGLTSKFIFIFNRFLRIYPLFFIFTLLTYISINIIGHVQLDLKDNWIPSNNNSLNFFTIFYTSLKFNSHDLPLLFPSANNLEQSWSLGVEIIFYLSILFGSFVNLKKFIIIFFTLSISYFLLQIFLAQGFNDFENKIYKEIFSTSFLFYLGGIIYFVEEKIKIKKFFKNLSIFFIFLLFLFSRYLFDPIIEYPNSIWKFVLLFFIFFILILVIIFILNDSKNESNISKFLGNLSFGIYINHFLVAYIVIFIANKYKLDFFPRLNSYSFGIFVLLLSTLCSYFFYIWLEMPLNRFRSFLKKK